MATFEIKGGQRMSGELYPQGAKNEALQVICACLLTEENVVIRNIPRIRDVHVLMDLLRDLGVKVTQLAPKDFEFCAKDVDVETLNDPNIQKKATALRGSILMIGPLLARFGKGVISRPGGDKIGRRRLDTHFCGFEKLGANFTYNEDKSCFRVEAKQLTGSYMLLDEASVTGTGNILMASVMAKGVTTIFNAACEPYIQQLCRMLNRMGARISGIGSNLLTVEGVAALGGCEHTLLPDMIEVGSFIGMAAMTGSEITIRNAG